MRHTPRLAIVLLGSVLLASPPALGSQDASPSGRQLAVEHSDGAPAANPLPVFAITIPTVDAVGSSVSASDIKAMLAGKAPDKLKELATLDAASIRIPEVRIEGEAQTGSTASKIVYVYKDIDIEAVKGGVAKSVIIGSTEETTSLPAFQMSLGKIVAHDLDVGGLLAFYGFVPGASPDQPLKPIYSGFQMEGGTLGQAGFECKIGAISGDAVEARPLRTSLPELMQLVTSPEFQKGNTPSPATVGKLLSFYVDFLDAFQTSPMTLQDLACSGKDDKGEQVSLKLGPVTIGGFGHDRYPSVEVKNFAVTAASGKVSVGDFTFKSFDLSGPIAVLKSELASGAPTQAWFTAHARDLIPAFEGFTASNFSMDVPDDKHPGTRIAATLGDFDLSLADYFHGIPTIIATSAHHFVYTLPDPVPGATDEFAGVRDLGMKTFNVGYDLKLHRDAAAQGIVVDQIKLTGDKLGMVDVSGVIGNVTDTLFTSSDQNVLMAAAIQLTLKSLKVDATDEGLGDIMLTRASAGQPITLPTMRQRMSGVIEGAILAGLGGTPTARTLGEAVGKFIGGDKSISVSAASANPNGLTVLDFNAAQADPAGFSAKVNVEATTK